MAKNLVAQVPEAGGELELVEREMPQPAAGEVRIRVEACGVCHSDSVTKDGRLPGIQYPRVPGHEVAGVVDAVGEGVTEWTMGERVGVGWHGGHDSVCESCRRGDFVTCQHRQITGVTRDGGYQQYMLARHEAVAALPQGLDAAQAAPLMDAGVTTYDALRHSGARAGDLVAVLGIGGLGHLGIQFAAKSGYRVVAVGRGAENEPLARKLGASKYLDNTTTDAAEELRRMGGARVILATATSAKATTDLLGGLKPGGELVVVGLPTEPLEVPAVPLALQRLAVRGWPAGTAKEAEDTLQFSAMTGVRPMIETFPLREAKQAYERMLSGKAEFRVVLTM